MKRILLLLLATAFVCLSFSACGKETKTLHCDNCGKEIKVPADSDMEESWMLYCSDCEKELGLDKIVPEM